MAHTSRSYVPDSVNTSLIRLLPDLPSIYRRPRVTPASLSSTATRSSRKTTSQQSGTCLKCPFLITARDSSTKAMNNGSSSLKFLPARQKAGRSRLSDRSVSAWASSEPTRPPAPTDAAPRRRDRSLALSQLCHSELQSLAPPMGLLYSSHRIESYDGTERSAPSQR